MGWGLGHERGEAPSWGGRGITREAAGVHSGRALSRPSIHGSFVQSVHSIFEDGVV